jgi:hypothetical protein
VNIELLDAAVTRIVELTARDLNPKKAIAEARRISDKWRGMGTPDEFAFAMDGLQEVLEDIVKTAETKMPEVEKLHPLFAGATERSRVAVAALRGAIDALKQSRLQ